MLSLVHTGRLYTLYSRRFQRLVAVLVAENDDYIVAKTATWSPKIVGGHFWQLYIVNYTTVVALFDDYSHRFRWLKRRL